MWAAAKAIAATKTDQMKDIVEKATEKANNFEFDVLAAIPESVMDSKMKAALREISKIGASIDTRLETHTGKLKYPFLLNFAIMRLYVKSLADEMKARTDRYYEDTCLEDLFFAQAMHFLRYSDQSYETLPGIAARDVILAGLNEHGKAHVDVHMPRHLMFFDHLTKSIVVCIRGTASMQDIITDLFIETETFTHGGKDMVAHQGIAQAAKALLPSIVAALQKIRTGKNSAKYNDYSVVVTGHSLGAGTASLLGLLLSETVKVTVFAYAPPPVLSVSNYSSRNCVIHTFVNNADVVPRACKLEVLKMLLICRHIDKIDDWNMTKRGKIVIAGTLNAEDKQIITDTLKAPVHLQQDKEVLKGEVELFVLGTVYVVHPNVDEPLSPEMVELTSSARALDVSSSSSSSADDEENGTDGAAAAADSKTTDPAPAIKGKGKSPAASEVSTVSHRFRRVREATGLYSGYLFTGDSMLSDHKAGAYISSFLTTVE